MEVDLDALLLLIAFIMHSFVTPERIKIRVGISRAKQVVSRGNSQLLTWQERTGSF